MAEDESSWHFAYPSTEKSVDSAYATLHTMLVSNDRGDEVEIRPTGKAYLSAASAMHDARNDLLEEIAYFAEYSDLYHQIEDWECYAQTGVSLIDTLARVIGEWFKDNSGVPVYGYVVNQDIDNPELTEMTDFRDAASVLIERGIVELPAELTT